MAYPGDVLRSMRSQVDPARVRGGRARLCADLCANSAQLAHTQGNAGQEQDPETRCQYWLIYTWPNSASLPPTGDRAP